MILAVSGVVMSFGKFFLLPIIGGQLFGWLTWLLKTMHNFVGPLFAVSMVVMFFTYLPSNWPTRADWAWLIRAGGMLGGEHPPSHRFNAGEKIVFWGGMLVLGVVVVVSGFVLDKIVPGLDLTRPQMQVVHIFHAVASMFMIALFIGHIYMGTIGVTRLVAGDEDRLCRRGLGRRAPPALARRHRRRQDPGAAQRGAAAAHAASSRRPETTSSPRKAMRPVHCAALLSVVLALPVLAKLPAPSDEAKAAAAETAAKAAWADKVGAYKLCQSQDRVADGYRKSGKASAPAAVQTAAPASGAAPAPVTIAACSRSRPLRVHGHAGGLQAARGLGRAFAARDGDLAAEHQRDLGRRSRRRSSAPGARRPGRRGRLPLRTVEGCILPFA